MTGAEYAKQRRDNAREKKLCLVCCKRPKLADKTTCVECTELKARYYTCSPNRFDGLSKALRTPDRFCVSCQAHGFHRDGCEHDRKAA